MSLGAVRRILCITQRRDEKRAAWRDWHQPDHRQKKLSLMAMGLFQEEMAWIPEDETTGWVTRRPPRIWDDRLQTPSMQQSLYCDSCGSWFTGFKAGSFRHLRLRPENDVVDAAWKKGFGTLRGTAPPALVKRRSRAIKGRPRHATPAEQAPREHSLKAQHLSGFVRLPQKCADNLA